jgi:predicted kinase
MATLTILMGIPGCGKSTWAENNRGDATIVSSDKIRKPGLYDPSDNNRVFAEFHQRIEDGLSEGRNQIADATNLEPRARAKLRRIARDTDSKTRLVIFTDLSQAVQRNDRRTGDDRVPDEAQERMLLLYVRQSVWAEGEGFDEIRYV